MRQENRAIGALILIMLMCWICLLFAAEGVRNVLASKGDNVPTYECGTAIGLQDSVPGYHITDKAHFVQHEDGSGRLVCNGRTVVRVYVPW